MSELSDVSESERYGTCDDEGLERVRRVATNKIFERKQYENISVQNLR